MPFVVTESALPIYSDKAVSKMAQKKASTGPITGPLDGWTAIATFLGIPVATAHRWAKDGMPVTRQGRFTVADPAELSASLGRESQMAKPARVMTGDADVAAALKESISVAKRETPLPSWKKGALVHSSALVSEKGKFARRHT